MIIDYDYLAEEFAKCYKDKSRVYMIQNFLKTYDATQKKDVAFKLFPRQQDLCKALGDASNVVTTKPRQAGITTTAGAFISCEMVLADKESPQTVLAIGNTMDLAQQMLFKIRDFLLQFPLWMWGDEYMDIGQDPMLPPRNKNVIFSVCNSKELRLKNGCKVVARSSGPDASRGVGGVTWLIFDEAAFIENGRDVYASALPTVSTGGHIILISTPNGKDMLYYETCRQAKLKGTKDWNNFELVEMKWYQDPRYNKYLEWTKKDSETGDIQFEKDEIIDKQGNIRFDPERWEKLAADGWSPRSPWYIRMCQQFNNDSQKIAQELDVSFLGSASNVVDPEFIEAQDTLNVREPLYVDPIMEDTWIWKEPIEGHRYICACLPEGQEVLTKNGYKVVEDVESDDELITIDGKFTTIKHRKYREVHDEKMVSIYTYGDVRPMNFTWNHPIYASTDTIHQRVFDHHKYICWQNIHNFQYHDAEKLKKDDWLVIPNVYRINEMSEEQLASHWEQYKNVGSEQYSTVENPLLNKDFWWYCGMWLAEGYIRTDDKGNKSVCTAHNINEDKYTDRIKNLSSMLFNRKVTENIRGYNNSRITVIWTKQVAAFLEDNFGKYACGKYINEWIKYIPQEYKIALLQGYFEGDGWACKNKEIGAESISLSLLEGIQDIFMSIGIIAQIKKHRSDNPDAIVCGKKCHTKQSYIISLAKTYAIRFLELQGKPTDDFIITNAKYPHKFSYFSDDLTLYYKRIKDIENYNYTGKVYNFEVTDNSHSFYVTHCVSHNCDNSRGDSSDRTAIEILDMDGIEEDGTPCLEQVLEYHGKQTGDVVGELIFRYANMYNEAYVIVECIGGVGDATILALQNLGYRNLYYDDIELNKFTMEREASSLKKNSEGKMPGFHSNSVRFQMLTFFANMVKTNQIKIRSKRVIAELDTWIYKGTAARIDHQDGCHDDTLTCLAMGCFVMNYSMKKTMAAKEKDKIILKSYRAGITSTASTRDYDIKYKQEISITPKKNYIMPIYTGEKKSDDKFGGYRWLIK